MKIRVQHHQKTLSSKPLRKQIQERQREARRPKKAPFLLIYWGPTKDDIY